MDQQKQQMQKWVNLGLLVIAAGLFVFLHQLAAAIWDGFRLPMPDWPFEPSQAIALVLAAGLVFWARRYEKANLFFNEVATELSKVTWPNRKETVSSAGVVIVLVALASVLLFVIDTIWRGGIRGLLSL